MTECRLELKAGFMHCIKVKFNLHSCHSIFATVFYSHNIIFDRITNSDRIKNSEVVNGRSRIGLSLVDSFSIH